jgi:hypothetical protein
MSDSFNWQPVATVFVAFFGFKMLSYTEREKARVTQLHSERAKGIAQFHSQLVTFHNILTAYVENRTTITESAVSEEYGKLFHVCETTSIYFPRTYSEKTRLLLRELRVWANIGVSMRKTQVISKESAERFVETGTRAVNAIAELHQMFRELLGMKDYEENCFSRVKTWWRKFWSGQLDWK